MQFATYGQFVLVFHRKGKPDVTPVDKDYFTWTTKAIRCHVIEDLYRRPSYLHIKGRGVYYKCRLVATVCHLKLSQIKPYLIYPMYTFT